MESECIFKEAYEYLDQLCKENMTGQVTIDYSKLDDKSKGELKDMIQGFIFRRKKEIGKVIFKAQ